MSASIRLGVLKPVNAGVSGKLRHRVPLLVAQLYAPLTIRQAVGSEDGARGRADIDRRQRRRARDDLGELNEIVGFHIRLAHGAVYRHFTETFVDLDLTQKQVSALWLVSDHPGISQIDLGGRLRMDRATTMTIVNRLQERGYMRRERSESDGRKQALYVTDAGLAALADAKACDRRARGLAEGPLHSGRNGETGGNADANPRMNGQRRKAAGR